MANASLLHVVTVATRNVIADVLLIINHPRIALDCLSEMMRGR